MRYKTTHRGGYETHTLMGVRHNNIGANHSNTGAGPKDKYKTPLLSNTGARPNDPKPSLKGKLDLTHKHVCKSEKTLIHLQVHNSTL